MAVAELPSVPGIVTGRQCLRTAESIAAAQESDGAIPWFTGGHTDPWDHVECAMALTATGLLTDARAAYAWSARTQRADGSWPLQFRSGAIENADTDTNFCAYLATGVWHYLCCTGDRAFAAELWPTVRAAVDYVLSLQGAGGEIFWLRNGSGIVPEALLTGCSSMFHSIRAALALAEFLGDPQPEWEVAALRLGHAIRYHPEVFTAKDRYSMDWYYPVLCGAYRGDAAAARIAGRWGDFVVGEIGIRCVDDRPWVTGAETCELALALDAVGERGRARGLLAAMQHLRADDGSYWTGLVFADGKHWPEERTTWTGAAMILAADALSRTSGGSGIFRDLAATADIATGLACDCVTA
ncbi:prenyltransferase [Nocardia sp. CDC159]|uniref:Prenyltransferase n=1 Tax=Nocardia pulmonis TaxID=2951408 RepID=A0A9X2IXA1_9NOCA|nr:MULTISPECIES: prenyltransferase [Nocardia]MCM6772691.1 prenyltransferase [Nocardia pulmonis]MCM6786006.1 prenyltransferase [Nocardia sp. CDC159]